MLRWKLFEIFSPSSFLFFADIRLPRRFTWKLLRLDSDKTDAIYLISNLAFFHFNILRKVFVFSPSNFSRCFGVFIICVIFHFCYIPLIFCYILFPFLEKWFRLLQCWFFEIGQFIEFYASMTGCILNFYEDLLFREIFFFNIRKRGFY